MSDSDRIRRPSMTRVKPDRAWQGVFGAPSPSHAQPQPNADAASPPADPATTNAGSAAEGARTGANGVQLGEPLGGDAEKHGSGLEDAISRSVEIGYRVIDDYLRQGRDVARTLRDGNATPQSLVRDTGDLTTRMMRYASDFVGTWLELFEMAAANGGANATNAGAPQQDQSSSGATAPFNFGRAFANVVGAATTAGESSNGAQAANHGIHPNVATAEGSPAHPAKIHTRVDLVVVTRRPVEASVRIDEPSGGRLRVHALRSADANVPRIREVEVVPAEDGASPVTLKVTVPDEQPAGAYEGLILDDERNVPIGIVRIVVRGDA